MKGRKYRKDPKTGKWVEFEAEKAPELHAVIQDTIDPFVSPIDYKKKIFTSRSKYEKHLRSKGFRMTGQAPTIQSEAEYDPEHNQSPSEARAADDRYAEDVKAAYYDVKYDRVKFTEQEKAIFQEETRKWKGKNLLKPPM